MVRVKAAAITMAAEVSKEEPWRIRCGASPGQESEAEDGPNGELPSFDLILARWAG